MVTVNTEVDDETYPLENITDLNQCLDVKLSERIEQEKEEKLLEESNGNHLPKKRKQNYRSYKPEVKEPFFTDFILSTFGCHSCHFNAVVSYKSL